MGSHPLAPFSFLEEANKFKGAYSSFAEEIRANCSRHILLTHDNWHILTGYNTDTLGEALLQTITAKCFNLYQAHLVGFFGMLKVVKETKNEIRWVNLIFQRQHNLL